MMVCILLFNYKDDEMYAEMYADIDRDCVFF